ncbi:hypothetical protein [Streptomyces chrestomyceticus]
MQELDLNVEELETLEAPSFGDWAIGVGAGALAAGGVVAGVAIFT